LGDTTIHDERWPPAHRYSQIPGARRCLRWRIAAEQVGREDFELKQAELDKSHQIRAATSVGAGQSRQRTKARAVTVG
jgi:hypothetical protein